MKPSIIEEVIIEYNRMKKNNPSWPDHPAAQAGRVTEKAGMLMHSSLEWKYERKKHYWGQEIQVADMRLAAIQTAVESLRFLEHLNHLLNGRQDNNLQQPDRLQHDQEDTAGEDGGRSACLHPARPGQSGNEGDNSGSGHSGSVLQDGNGADPA